MGQPVDVTIKGIRQGLLIRLRGGTWDAQLAQLAERLRIGASFFKGGQVALDVGDQALAQNDLQAARDLLSTYEVTLWAIVSPNDDTTLVAARMGLTVNMDVGERVEAVAPPADDDEVEDLSSGVLVIDRTLRSGQKAHHPGHVIVFGDVHSGAEVIAGGHVVVWGSLRGVVHAGAFGDEGARVCALDLSPTQLRIAGHIARSPDDKRRRPVPEMAQVRSHRIEAVPWKKN